MAHPTMCRCPTCAGRVQDTDSVDEELLAKFNHRRRLSEGRSEARLNGGGCKCLGESEGGGNEPTVDVRGAVAFFEGEIAKESDGAAYSRMRQNDLSAKYEPKPKSRSRVGSSSCGCDGQKSQVKL